ncbi:hypothetical protein Lal_00042087 [Lupinus albus]|nr:hypothetical protein Lal_00042087 [Lupinus albus]
MIAYKIIIDDIGSRKNNGGLSPPNDNDGNVEAEENDDEDEQMYNDPYQELQLHRCDCSLIDLTTR